VWKPGQGFIWRTPTRDCSSNTGSSVFDFEGKGEAKVVYSDQCFFRIYDGKTGAPLIEEKNSSCTAYEMPIVADIDGTGRAGVQVTFTAHLQNGQTALLGTATTQTGLQPGGSEKVSIPWPGPPETQSVTVEAVVDPQNLVGDCHADNNRAMSAPVKCGPLG